MTKVTEINVSPDLTLKLLQNPSVGQLVELTSASADEMVKIDLCEIDDLITALQAIKDQVQ